MRATLFVTCLALAMLGCSSTTGDAEDGGASTSENPIELGTIHWERDHIAALARAEREDKDVLMLFQEVPG